MEIGKIVNIGKALAPKNETPKSLSTNPFGVSFKGSVIQADVFESSNTGLTNKISNKSKMFASAIVGGINNFNEAFKARMNSVVSFGRKMSQNVADTLTRWGNIEVSLNINDFAETVKNKMFPDSQYKVKNLAKKSAGELGDLLQAAMSA